MILSVFLFILKMTINIIIKIYNEICEIKNDVFYSAIINVKYKFLVFQVYLKYKTNIIPIEKDNMLMEVVKI